MAGLLVANHAIFLAKSRNWKGIRSKDLGREGLGNDLHLFAFTKYIRVHLYRLRICINEDMNLREAAD